MPRSSIIAFILVLFAATAQGHWAQPDGRVPVSRLTENLAQQLAANPEDPHLLARLARVHSLAYALGDVEFPVMGKGENPQYTYYEQGSGYPATRHSLDRSAIAAGIDHLMEAIALYEKAAKLAPGERRWDLDMTARVRQGKAPAASLPSGSLASRVGAKAGDDARATCDGMRSASVGRA